MNAEERRCENLCLVVFLVDRKPAPLMMGDTSRAKRSRLLTAQARRVHRFRTHRRDGQTERRPGGGESWTSGPGWVALVCSTGWLHWCDDDIDGWLRHLWISLVN